MNVLNKSAKSIIIGWVIPFIIIPYCHAQQERRTYVPAQPMELHFRFDRTLPDSGYMDNIHVFNALDSLFSSHDTVSQKISSIHILAFASPDGNTAYNEQLAERRAINIKNYRYVNFPISIPAAYTLVRKEKTGKDCGVLSTKNAISPTVGRYCTSSTTAIPASNVKKP